MKALEELKAALEAATPGDWVCDQKFIVAPDPRDVFQDIYVAEVVTEDDEDRYDPLRYEYNAHLIALMHNALPALIEAAEALENLVICPAFNGQVFERDKESHREWTLARDALAKLQGSKS